MFRFQITQVSISVIMLLLLASVARAQDCDVFVRAGMYDYTLLKNDTETFNQYAEWFRSQRKQTYKEAQSTGFTLSVMGKGSLGYDNSEEGFREFTSDVESARAGIDVKKTKVLSVIKAVNPLMAKALSDCMNKGGWHIYLQRYLGGRNFDIVASYVGSDTPEVIRRMTLTNTRCSEPIGKGGSIDWKVTSNRQQVKCSWPKRGEPVTISIGAASQSAGLPTLLELRPEPPKPPDLFEEQVAIPNLSVARSMCTNEAVPAMVPVSVSLNGSWDEIDTKTGKSVLNRTGVSVINAAWPTFVYTFNVKTKKEEAVRRYEGNRTIDPRNDPFLVCVRAPIREKADYTVRISDQPYLTVKDSRE